MKNYFLLLLLVTAGSFSQSISEYRYAIIPAKFNAQKKSGQFGLNELTRQFLMKNGYTAYLDSEILPVDVTKENCNKIYVDVFENNTMLKTKLRVVIKDCTNKILFTSEEGESTDKDNRIAYNQALRAAFKSFDKPEFRHNPSPSTTAGNPSGMSVTPIAEQEVKAILMSETSQKNVEPESNFLSMQPIENGYQFVDTTPKIVLKVFKTSNPEVFMAENGQQNGVLIKKSGQWFFEYYNNKRLVSQQMNIRL